MSTDSGWETWWEAPLASPWLTSHPLRAVSVAVAEMPPGFGSAAPSGAAASSLWKSPAVLLLRLRTRLVVLDHPLSIGCGVCSSARTGR